MRPNPDFVNCQVKIAYRQEAVINPWKKLHKRPIAHDRQFVTCAGDLQLGLPGDELVQLKKAGVYTSHSQVHAITWNKDTYVHNVQEASEHNAPVHNHFGDMCDILREHFDSNPNFKPALIHADFMQGPLKCLEYLKDITSAIEHYMPDDRVMLVWNVVRKTFRGAAWDQQLDMAQEWIEESDWKMVFDHDIEYDGTSKTNSVMRTKVLTR